VSNIVGIDNEREKRMDGEKERKREKGNKVPM
jgi:hypothetical protein